MKFHRGIVALAAMAVIGLGMRSGSAASVSISTGSFSSAASPVGSFTGTVDYNALALPQPRLTVTLTNTGTTAMNIVGFAFNFPNDIVDHLALVTPASGWQLTSDAAASPFSNFDALVSTDGSFNGGGPGTGGILPNGGTGTWNLSVFLKSPHVAADLSTVSFLSEADTKKDQVFVVRFQGEGGSNKYGASLITPSPNAIFPVPLPAAVWSGGALIVALAAVRRIRRKSAV